MRSTGWWRIAVFRSAVVYRVPPTREREWLAGGGGGGGGGRCWCRGCSIEHVGREKGREGYSAARLSGVQPKCGEPSRTPLTLATGESYPYGMRHAGGRSLFLKRHRFSGYVCMPGPMVTIEYQTLYSVSRARVGPGDLVKVGDCVLGAWWFILLLISMPRGSVYEVHCTCSHMRRCLDLHRPVVNSLNRPPGF